jgi:hypothetical protein
MTHESRLTTTTPTPNPNPNPSPQGGGEHTERAERLSSTNENALTGG